MGKAPRPVRLDFVATVHEAPVAGVVLCVVGVAAALALGLAFHAQLTERSRLDAALGDRTQPHKAATSHVSPESAKAAATIAHDLSIPWTRLLAELEAASHDSASRISLLQVEPDPTKNVLRITAEVRAMSDALAYLKRLQKSDLLRFPMLESHERRKDDPEHPLRITLAAEWRT